MLAYMETPKSQAYKGSEAQRLETPLHLPGTTPKHDQSLLLSRLSLTHERHSQRKTHRPLRPRRLPPFYFHTSPVPIRSMGSVADGGCGCKGSEGAKQDKQRAR